MITRADAGHGHDPEHALEERHDHGRDHDHDHGDGHSHDHDHDHGDGHSHDHDHAFETEPTPTDAQEIDGVEQITLLSAGLDVGSSTSHLAISRLVLRRKADELSTQLVIAERASVYQSSVLLTPYRSDTLIDADALEHFLDAAYAEAGLRHEDIDTGVVIVTGEAANRPNAEQLAQRFAARSGTFICVSAGPHYEALLGAHGSGAVDISRRERSRVLNVDMGGGTTKLSVIDRGEISHTAALSIGARLIAFDEDGTLQRVEPPAMWMLAHLGSTGAVGAVITPESRDELARLMAGLLFDIFSGRARSPLLQRLWVTDELEPSALSSVDTVVFSGGVSEYVYGREHRDFGDLGTRLGALVQDGLAREGLAGKVRTPKQGIRATVLGAGEHSMQASGVTSFLDDDQFLPALGLKVVRADVTVAAGLGDALQARTRRLELDGGLPGLVYALNVHARVDYRLLRAVAEELARVASRDEPLFVVLDVDVAHALGRILRQELGWSTPLIVLDGLVVGDLDYLDIGQPMWAGTTVPVTVKSLTFITR